MEGAAEVAEKDPDLEDPVEGRVSENAMVRSTRLKYERFRGDGHQDVNDWLGEFESMAIAEEEVEGAKRRIFQGLLKGEALKWYQDLPADETNDWEQLKPAFLYTFREAGGEATALGKLSTIRKKPHESVRRYGQKVKALIQRLTFGTAPKMEIEWYVSGLPDDMEFQIRQSRPLTLHDAMEAAQNHKNTVLSL